MEEQKVKKPLIRFSHANLIGLLIGLLGGYLYYYFIGCTKGTCPITSNPWISTFWGGAIGYLGSDLFNFRRREKSQDSAR
jgi:hypothetical protein